MSSKLFKVLGCCLVFLFIVSNSVFAAACPTTNIFTTPGTCTYTVPAGVSSIEVFVMGGGGGGGGGCSGVSSTSTCCSGSGGNGGGAAKISHQMVSVTPGQQYEITVGAGGAGSGAGSIYGITGGSSGASSSFGSTVVSAGGAGGDHGWIILEHNGSAGGAGADSSVAGINASAGSAGADEYSQEFGYYIYYGGAGGLGGNGYGAGGGGGGGGVFGGFPSGGNGGTGANGYVRVESGTPCGSAASRTAVAPTTNLCAPNRGTASKVSGTGSGPFTWTCSSGQAFDSASFLNIVNGAQSSSSSCNGVAKQTIDNNLPGSFTLTMNHQNPSMNGVCMCDTAYPQYQNVKWNVLRTPLGYKITSCASSGRDSFNWPIWKVVIENETAVSCATTVNQNPVVNAGANITITGGSTVTFNDAVVTDPEGDPLSYFWYCGEVGALLNPTSLQAQFVAPTVSSNTSVACQLFAYDDKGGIMFGVKNITVTACSNPGAWTTNAPLPTTRSFVSSAAVNDKIYVIGGNDGCQSNQFDCAVPLNQEYDPVADTWATKAPMLDNRQSVLLAVVNNKIYAMGGQGVAGKSNVNQEYNPATNTWIDKASMPSGYTWNTVAAANNKIYVLGSHVVGQTTVLVNKEYDPATNTWSDKAPPPNAGFLTASVVNNKMYVMDNNINQEYDPVTNTWTAKAGAVMGGSVTSSVVNNKIYVISSTTKEYNPATNTWATGVAIPLAMSAFSSSSVNNKIYTFSPQGNREYCADCCPAGTCGATQIGAAHRILTSGSASLCDYGTVNNFTGTAYGPWLWACNSTSGNSGICSASFSNAAPTISTITGASTINEGATLGLNATATDADGDTSLSYSWTCTGGSLVNGNTATPTYTAPMVTNNTTNTCTVTVSDIFGASVSRTMNITTNDNPVVGACGTANGQRLTVAPTLPAQLCNTGDPSPATPTLTGNTWNWTCVGSSTVSCSATKTLPNWTEQ
ncbi:MAG: hypothetical protein WC470_00025 [Candidatus Paceibacterota bacterium]